MFEYFVYGLLWMVLGVSLFIWPVLSFLVTPEYVDASALVPIICLGFLFFGPHEHLKVPAMLEKQSVSLVRAYAVAAAANVGMNLDSYRPSEENSHHKRIDEDGLSSPRP